MIRHRTLTAALLTLSLAAGSALAQDTMPPAATSAGGSMQSMRMHRMDGMNVKGMHRSRPPLPRPIQPPASSM